jgi:hypothetical protein
VPRIDARAVVVDDDAHPQIRSILIDQRRVISARRAGDTCEKRSATIAIPRNR